jgi:hypothetical protein
MSTKNALVIKEKLPVPDGSFAGKSYIGMVVDKSGSMATVVDDVIGGFNMWLERLREADAGERAVVSFTLFDTVVEERNTLANLAAVLPLDRQSYIPGGNTALLDAAYTTIKKLEESVTPDDRALVLIITDGQENSSVEINREQLRTLIAELTNRGNWTFAYLGSDPSTFDEAGGIGVAAGSTQAYSADKHGTVSAYATASLSTNRWMDSAKSSDSAFFEEDR